MTLRDVISIVIAATVSVVAYRFSGPILSFVTFIIVFLACGKFWYGIRFLPRKKPKDKNSD